MKKTYLFDFDGTLVDSMPTFVAGMLKILDDRAIPYGEDIVKIITPLGAKGSAEYFISLGLDMPIADVLKEMLNNMAYGYEQSIPAKKNVPETLRALKARGDSLNVLTASPHNTLDPCLKRLGLYDLFDNVWSCDDFGTTKANPDIYRMAAEKLGCDVSEVIFLDDNYNADLTAKSAGMTVYGVYDSSSEEYTEEIKAITDGYISDFSELL